MGRRSLGFLVAVLVVVSAAIEAAPTGRASWDRAQVQVVTIHYTTHEGFSRAAEVVLPDWYGP